MKVLFYILILIVVVFLNVGYYLAFIHSVDEESILKNIKYLKKYNWFLDLLRNEEYKQLIVHDRDVREVIGRFNHNKMDSQFFQNRYQKKLVNILHRKSNV